MREPIRTTIEITNPNDGVEFPPIVFCSLFRLSKKKAAEFGIFSQEQAEFLYASFGPLYTPLDYDLNYFQNSVLSKISEIEIVEKILKNQTILELFEKISINCEEIVENCRLNGEKIANCCSEIKNFFTREGPCFHLKILDDYFQKRPGQIGGFEIDLNFPFDDFIPTVFNSFYQRGIFVYSHPLAAALARDPVIVALGEYSIIQFHATKHSNMPGKGKRCIKEEKNILKYFTTYR